METAFWISWQDIGNRDLPEGRIYLGDEACEKRLPPAADMEDHIRSLVSSGHPVTLVTPWISESGLRGMDDLLTRLAKPPVPIELVVNDWGVLQSIKPYKYLTPVIGRLLCGQSSDPRLADGENEDYQKRFEKTIYDRHGTPGRLKYHPPSQLFTCHIQSPAIIHPHVLAYLAGLNISRIEVSHLRQGLHLELPKGWQASLVTPQVLVSLKRCRRPHCDPGGCARQVQTIHDPAFRHPLMVSPCEVYDLNPLRQGEQIPDVIDRIVIKF